MHRTLPAPTNPGPRRPNGPLPEIWPYGRFRGLPIRSLPDGYRRWARQPERRWPRLLRGALEAADGFHTLARDPQEGR